MAERKTSRSGGKSRSKSTTSGKSTRSGTRSTSKSAGSGGSRKGGGSSSRRGGANGSSSGRSGASGPSARDIAIGAVRQVQDLMGRPVEAVTGLEKNGSEWTVTVEVVELQRIPNTTDVLGAYEVTVDKNGELVGARRTRRFNRSQAGDGE